MMTQNYVRAVSIANKLNLEPINMLSELEDLSTEEMLDLISILTSKVQTRLEKSASVVSSR